MTMRNDSNRVGSPYLTDIEFTGARVMPLQDPIVTASNLTNELASAPHVAAIYHGIVAQEEAAQDASDLAWQKQQRQNGTVLETQRAYNIALSNYNSAESDGRAQAKRDLDAAEAAWKREIETRNGMKGSVIYDGLPSAKVAREIQKIRFAHVLDPNAPTVKAPSLQGIAKAQADRLTYEAELQDVLKTPGDTDEAIRRVTADIDRAVANVRHKWPFTRYYRNERDPSGRTRPASVGLPKLDVPGGGTVPDAYALVLLTLAPLVRESAIRQVRDAGEAFAFEGQLSAAERKKKVESLQRKIVECVAIECAHIRGLALAGQCPPIRKDLDPKILFALAPEPQAKADFDAEQAEIKKRGGSHVGVATRGPSTRIVAHV